MDNYFMVCSMTPFMSVYRRQESADYPPICSQVVREPPHVTAIAKVSKASNRSIQRGIKGQYVSVNPLLLMSENLNGLFP